MLAEKLAVTLFSVTSLPKSSGCFCLINKQTLGYTAKNLSTKHSDPCPPIICRISDYKPIITEAKFFLCLKNSTNKPPKPDNSDLVLSTNPLF